MSSLGRPSGGLAYTAWAVMVPSLAASPAANRRCCGRNASLADALDALCRADDMHGWIGRGDARNGLRAGVVAVVVGQEDEIRVQRRFVEWGAAAWMKRSAGRSWG